MTYSSSPLIIPAIATGYLLAIYLLLVLAQRSARGASASNVISTKELHK
jgi:hypothetical protein